jgi:hypothetical protein
MSVFKKDTVVKSFPAVDIVTREKDSQGVINVTAGDHVTDASFHSDWVFGSVASYALENNECPFMAAERANTFGHELYWLNQSATVISSNPSTLPKRILLQPEDVVRFEGKLFTLQDAPNNNKSLIPYSPE